MKVLFLEVPSGHLGGHGERFCWSDQPSDNNVTALAHALVWQTLHLLEQEDSRGQGHDLLGQYSLAGPEQQHDATPALWAVVVPLPLRLH